MESANEIVIHLKSLSNQTYLKSMERFGIPTKYALGIALPVLRKYAKQLGKNHELAEKLWKTKIHEARLLAVFIDDAKKVTRDQMDRWAGDFYSWDICDQTCGSLFDRTPFAYKKAMEWASNEKEFIKRAGFAMMAALAVHDKKAKDEMFMAFFAFVEKEAWDDRNFVKKAANWALRQIGKRNMILNKKAIYLAEKIQKQDNKSAKWIASDALRELRSEAIKKRLKKNNIDNL